MQVTLDTTDIGPAEAVGLILLLNSVSPGALGQAALVSGVCETVTFHNDETRQNSGTSETRATPFPGLSQPVTDALAHGNEMIRAAADNGYGHDQTEAAPVPAEVFGGDPPHPAVSGVTLGDATLEAIAHGYKPPTLDADGLPWDGRIHSSNKKFTAAGKWWGRKGVAADVTASVIEELRRVQAIPATPAAEPFPHIPEPPETVAERGPVPDAEVTPPPPPVVPAIPAPPPVADVPPPPVPVAPPADAPPPAAPSAVQVFGDMMKVITPAQTAGKLTVVEVNQLCTDVGVRELREVLNRPDLAARITEGARALIAAATTPQAAG